MFDDTRSYALGSQAWFYPENTAYTSPVPGGNVGQNNLPDKNDPGWVNMFIGDVEEWQDKKKVETDEILKPSPGHLVRKDILTFFVGLDIELTTNSLRRIAMQIMYGSSTVLSAGVSQFTPMSAVPPRGWLKLQRYTQDDVLVFAADLWIRCDVQEMSSGNKKTVKPKFMINLLDSQYNTMEFGDPSTFQ
jgi:hypothetical protein